MEQRFLGEILQRRAGVPPERLEAMYAVQKEKGIDLVDLLVNGTVLDEQQIAKALAEEAELPYVPTVEHDRISTALATRLPITFAKSRARKMIVVHEDDNAVYVLVGDPFDTTAIDEVRILFGKPVEASVAPSEKIEDAINRVYEREAGGGELESDEAQVDENEVAGGDILDSDDEAPVIRWVNSLFLQAMKERASDIHIEPEEKEVIVRYRIDGVLQRATHARRDQSLSGTRDHQPNLKIDERKLNIAEKRHSAGRPHQAQGLWARNSTFALSDHSHVAATAKRIVMRILDKDRMKSSSTCAASASPTKRYTRSSWTQLIHKLPHGIILVTGPTGSGKTTTPVQRA